MTRTILFLSVFARCFTANCQYLDGTFGTNGVARFDWTGSSDGYVDLEASPNGGYYAVGHSWDDFGLGAEFGMITHILEDGSGDPDVGVAGSRYVNFSGIDTYFTGLSVQPDGRVLVAGWVVGEFDAYPVICRFLPTGDLDPSFGGGEGFVIQSDLMYYFTDVLALQGGGFVAIGQGNEDPWPWVRIRRFTANGEVDGSYGNGSDVMVDLEGGTDHAVCVEEAPDGGLYVGAVTQIFSDFTRAALFHLLPNGDLDLNYAGGNAIVSTLNHGEVRDLLLLDDGKLLCLKKDGPSATEERLMVERYTSDGLLDITFGTNGRTTVSSPFGGCFQPAQLALASNGDIVTGGCVDSDCAGGNVEFVVLRLTADGVLYTWGGANGLYATDGSGVSEASMSSLHAPLVLDAEERVLMCGTYYSTPVLDAMVVAFAPLAVGLEDVQVADGLQMFPNPASDLVHVPGGRGAQGIEVFDATGRRMVLTAYDGRVDVSNLSEGAYVVRVQNGTRVRTMPLVVAR